MLARKGAGVLTRFWDAKGAVPKHSALGFRAWVIERRQPKMRPLVLEIAAACRFWTSSQFTTFQNALT